ncbi:MAG: arginyltransferase, partial [Acinetobacter towneri]
VYTFFDPDESRRSLGTFAVLKQIEQAQHLGLQYVYLGYWVPHSNKMNYKSQYVPLELLLDGQWRRINRSLNADEVQQLGNSLMTTLPLGWNNSIIK